MRHNYFSNNTTIVVCLLLLLACAALGGVQGGGLLPPDPLRLQPCLDLPSDPAPRTMPLCGNGVLDVGELCDDGNRVDGDGCNSFCSAFDALAAVGTLAGGTAVCPHGRPVLGGASSAVLFCNLRAIEATPDGQAVLLADGGALLRYELFTDALTGTVTQLAATVDQPMRAICSLAALGPDGTLLIHDCGAARWFTAPASGARAQPVADMSLMLAPPDAVGAVNLKSYYNRTARLAVTAGVLLDTSAGGCIGVYGLTVSADGASAARTDLAVLPCTAYGVWEAGAQYTSFDMRGMLPHLVARDRCPPTFRAGEWCYVVYMQRPAHLELLRAYVPELGGLDVQYYASTQNLYDNALGPPLIRASSAAVGGGGGGGDGRVYTLRGACLQLESRTLSPDGRAPPTVTLGNTCQRAPRQGLRCATPLNNAFLTDAVASPVLLPLGLSATHTHGELSTIFDSACPALANTSSAGPLLYRSVLASVYGNATPVDFVELPSTLDVVFVTPTSVGLISTKRVLFTDRMQPGYVRPTNLLYCPSGRFGAVGGVCAACSDRSAPGHLTSIAWQIQCASAAYAPYETFTVVGSPEATQQPDALHAAMCVFTEGRNVSCPSDVAVLPAQVYNLDADAAASGAGASGAASGGASGTTTDLIRCLIGAAETATGATLFRANSAEYLTRVVAAGSAMLTAAAARTNATAPQYYSDPALAAVAAPACRNALARGVTSFLSCAVPSVVAAQSARAGARRRLFGTAAPVAAVVVAHQNVAVGSSAPISYTRAAAGDGGAAGDAAGNASTTDAPPPTAAADANGGPPTAEIAGITVAGACVVAALVALFYHYRCGRPRTAIITGAHFRTYY